jgi:energy-coupling factor transport system permease protein
VIARRHPLAKLVGAILLVLAISFLGSLAALGVVGGALLAVVASCTQRPWRALGLRMVPFVVLALAMSWIYLVAEDPAHRAVPGHGAWTAAVVAARILAMGLASLAFAETTRADDLARALEQNAGLPRRTVQGVLAAIQFLPALAEDYRLHRLLHRGSVAPGRRFARLRRGLAGLSPDLALVLFAGALRRAGEAALSMQMRGLGPGTPASSWRRRDPGPADAVVVAAALGLVLVAAWVGSA